MSRGPRSRSRHRGRWLVRARVERFAEPPVLLLLRERPGAMVTSCSSRSPRSFRARSRTWEICTRRQAGSADSPDLTRVRGEGPTFASHPQRFFAVRLAVPPVFRAVPVVFFAAVPVVFLAAVPVLRAAVPVVFLAAVPVLRAAVPVVFRAAVPVLRAAAVPVVFLAAVPVVFLAAVPVVFRAAEPVVFFAFVPARAAVDLLLVPVVFLAVVPVDFFFAAPARAAVVLPVELVFLAGITPPSLLALEMPYGETWKTPRRLCASALRA